MHNKAIVDVSRGGEGGGGSWWGRGEWKLFYLRARQITGGARLSFVSMSE